MALKLEVIKIRTWSGVEDAAVWRGRDFAVHDFLFEPGCEIVHCPSGFALPARFEDQQQAERVMAEVQQLRSDWDCVPIDKIGPRMAFAIKQIVCKHNGLWLDMRGRNMNNLAAKVYDTQLNGNSPVRQ